MFLKVAGVISHCRSPCWHIFGFRIHRVVRIRCREKAKTLVTMSSLYFNSQSSVESCQWFPRKHYNSTNPFGFSAFYETERDQVLHVSSHELKFLRLILALTSADRKGIPFETNLRWLHPGGFASTQTKAYNVLIIAYQSRKSVVTILGYTVIWCVLQLIFQLWFPFE